MMQEKKFLKLTRKSYRRKLILFGMAIFMSLALTATGFAAWILSKDATKNDHGDIQVGTVSESSIEITDITFKDDIKNFAFDADKNDTTGRVRYDPEKGTFENLGVQLSWTVKNFSLVGETYVEFLIPASIQNAIDAGYIDFAAGAEDNLFKTGVERTINKTTGAIITSGEEGSKYYVYKLEIPAITANDTNTNDELSWTVTKVEDVIESVTFTLDLKFTWDSERFGGKNPGEWYDTVDEGKAVPFDEVRSTLNEMRATLLGVADMEAFKQKSFEDQNAELETLAVDPYWVIIYANVK